MKALVIARLTGPEALEVRDVPEPELKPGQVLIRVTACGLNFADLMTTRGRYPGTPAPPLIAGREFAGVEVATGRRVMGYTQYAAFAEKVAVHSHMIWPVPDEWTDEQGAAFPVNFFTAYLAYWQSGMTTQPRPDAGAPASAPAAGSGNFEGNGHRLRVLIHAVAGGVGTAAVQIGRLLNIEMYGTSSSEEKLSRVKALGLEHPIQYRQHDYEEVVKNITHGEGVDSVFEMLGGEHTAKSIRCLRPFGRVIQYGTATGKQPQLDLRAMYAKSASVQGLWLTYLAQKPEIMEPAWHQLSAWIHQLKPQIGQVLSLSEARQGYEVLVEGKNYGKLVLKL